MPKDPGMPQICLVQPPIRDFYLTAKRTFPAGLAAGALRAAGFSVELRAMNGLMPSTLDEDLLDLMQAAGFRSLNLSLGTAVPRRARYFRRPDLRRAFDRALCTAARLGMTVNCVGPMPRGTCGPIPVTRCSPSVSDGPCATCRYAPVGTGHDRQSGKNPFKPDAGRPSAGGSFPSVDPGGPPSARPGRNRGLGPPRSGRIPGCC